MRILFALSGLHQYDRGAEIAFISIAEQLAIAGTDVTIIGSGVERASAHYRFLGARNIARERFRSFPSLPLLRDDCAYEELTFAPSLLRRFHPNEYDVTVTCSYPYTNWILRRPVLFGKRPPHIFVTQNGDWPAYSKQSEYKFFGCEGLVCTNPEYYERNSLRWNCKLIPNGVDCERFKPGNPQRGLFNIPAGKRVVLMVSAFIPSKRLDVGIDAIKEIADTHLVIAGTGPLRSEIESKAQRLIPERFTILSVAPEQMPALYRSADVFLHLSKDESFGNVFLEALASGLPIIGHDSPRTRWIVGEDQFLVDTNSLTDVIRAITAARRPAPEQQREWLARAETFSWTKIGHMYRTFFEEVLAKSNTGAK